MQNPHVRNGKHDFLEIKQPDERTLLPGWPGYRTRPGRSGLDYIDTQQELAHITGVYIRKVFSGSWLHSGSGFAPLLTLLIAVLLLLNFVTPSLEFLVVMIVLIAGGIVAVFSRRKNSLKQRDESRRPNDQDGIE